MGCERKDSPVPPLLSPFTEGSVSVLLFMYRKRTFQDRKFSQGDSNSNAYRDSWDRMFGQGTDDIVIIDECKQFARLDSAGNVTSSTNKEPTTDLSDEQPSDVEGCDGAGPNSR